MNKKIILYSLSAIILIAISFWAGMKYSQASNPGALGKFGIRNWNFSPDQRMGANRATSPKNGFVAGKIISKDDKSLTVQVSDGGSKVIFFSTTTKAVKSAELPLSEIGINQQVNINGLANADGSISAQMIMIQDFKK